MTTRILWQIQLSNYNSDKKFVLTADSNWQIFALKAREIVKHLPNIHIDVLVPLEETCAEDPQHLLSELGLSNKNIQLIHISIAPNAPRTRYDFPWSEIEHAIDANIKDYTHVYINDPLMLAHYKALFHLKKLKPKFILQTHFLDSPVAQIVDTEISYWLRTVDACEKSDIFLWHCVSMQTVFREALEKEFQQHVVERLMTKSSCWKDGFSIAEISAETDPKKIRFSIEEIHSEPNKENIRIDGLDRIPANRHLVWVPNRIGVPASHPELGASFDYTNNGRFMLDIVPELWKIRQDFNVIAGNPSQKISNEALAHLCTPYRKLLDGAPNRDEYRLLSRVADIVVGLYTNDTNGGLASLEAIELGAVPVFADVYEYKICLDAVKWPSAFRVKPDLSDCAEVLSRTMNNINMLRDVYLSKLQKFVREYASYEATTEKMVKRLGL